MLVAAIIRPRLPFHPQTFPGMRLYRTRSGRLVLAVQPQRDWRPECPRQS